MKLPQFFFKYRSYTPIPLILVLLYQADPAFPGILLGVLSLLLGESIRFWAILYAGGATRTRNVGAKSLVTAGPYGYLRNPLYLGNILIYVGVVFIAGGPWMWQMLVIAVGFFMWQYSQIITLEEETLADLFGKEYREYQQHVPRIIPRLSPWRKPEHAEVERRTLGQALKPEKSTLYNITGMLLLIAAKWFYLQM